MTTADHTGLARSTALRLDDVSFGFGQHDVVRAVTLKVDVGERVGLLGPNGAGKSTLLRLASGVLRPRSGQIWLGDDALGALPRREIARRVAVVPQEFAVQFAYTVRQLVELGRTPHTGSWGLLGTLDTAAVDRALAATELTALAGRVFNSLSGGERQRVLIAMALAQGSPLVLLDEPTAHLDIRHQIEVLELLGRLNRDHQLTVIAALHDLNLAARYFPRLVLFRQQIVVDGPPAVVLDSTLLTHVYQTPVHVGILRGEAYLSVLPPSHPEPRDRAEHANPSAKSVHVVAGGGTGELMMRSLADAELRFTAGALNIGDSDYVLATQLAETCVSESPYASISPQALATTRALMAEASAIIVCPTPFGPGNIALLEAALLAAQAGGQVLLLEPERPALRSENDQPLADHWHSRDFTGGIATAAYGGLLEAGARIFTTPAAIVAFLRVYQDIARE